ncbi:MAG: hypothetical protein H0T17_02405 [Propionibacteriales bacterium]|nr:hypothetical protein [Propionibacteriales bacterium]
MTPVSQRAIATVGSVVLAVTSLATTVPADARDAPSSLVLAPPIASLRAATDTVTLPKYGKRVGLDLGVYLVAGDEPIDIRASRTSYAEPIAATVVTAHGDVPLPGGLMPDFQGAAKFFGLRLRDRDGNVVLWHKYRFCPQYGAVRVGPDGPDTSRYPQGCPYNPYTLGAVYGVDEGYGIPVFSEYGNRPALELGRYEAEVWMTRTYRKAFGVTYDEASVTVQVRVVKGEDCLEKRLAGCATASVPQSHNQALSGMPQSPVASRPAGRAVPTVGSRPDLRSLPAFAIELHRGKWLRFAANVWNAGPAPLVVDGFRRSGEDVMDAYQYFYDTDGNQVGYAPAGAMEWDERDGHTHWHFRDFARYRLLDKDKNHVVRSRKEAFCLANTDAVDYTVPGANWRPENTDLRTSCGSHSALSVREVLDAGSGDTYYQYVAGQSFDVSDLPNGTYFVAVEANPHGVLYEAATDNNVSYRKVILKGTAGHRLVRVPQVGLVEE